MNFHCHCFESLSIRRCVLCGRSRGRHAPPGDARVTMIQDMAVDLCVVSAPRWHMDSLDADDPLEQWDTMTVDRSARIAMLTGPHFEDLVAGRPWRGRPVCEVFDEPVADVLEPLLNAAQRTAHGAQLHTIYKSKALTLFAYPLRNEVQGVVGSHIIYRPTKYSQADISALIAGTAAACPPAPALPAPASPTVTALSP